MGSCGRVPDWSRTNLRLVRYDVESDTHPRDEHGFYQLCKPGEVGEAMGFIVDHPQIGGGRFEGYTSAAASESKIRRNVFQAGDAYWSSGDLLRYDDDGYFYFVDRIGDTFRWKSENVSTLEVAGTLSDLPGLELINVYGVHVPGHEGRAGMAAILMQLGQTFDPQAFYDLTEARLPRYAAPMFVRVSATADMTSTFKLRKVDLQRQGYAPGCLPTRCLCVTIVPAPISRTRCKCWPGPDWHLLRATAMSDIDSQGHEWRDGLRYPWPQAPANGQVQEVAEGVFWLRMPLPFGLDHINLYLLRHGDGWVAVDTGLNSEQCRAVWEQVFVEVLQGLALKAVICTHYHSDHTGVVGWLAERFAARY